MSLTPVLPRINKLREQEIRTALRQGIRIDGRGFDEYRSIQVTTGVVSQAEGSANALIGGTRVMAGVKIGLATPYSDQPNMGVLIVNAEFVPLASPTFEPGPPDENAIELARVIDRGIRSSKVILLEEYAPLPGRRVYVFFIDIYVLDHLGNLLDTAALASIAALYTAKIPKVEVVGDEVSLNRSVTESIRTSALPITVTVAKVFDHLLVDPNLEEELLAEARIAITTTERDTICAVQKMGSGAFTRQEIEECVELAFKCRPKIEEALRQAIGHA